MRSNVDTDQSNDNICTRRELSARKIHTASDEIKSDSADVKA